MELLPLPNFYHTILLILFLIIIAVLFYFLRPKRAKKERIKLNTKEDIYEFSIKLQKLGSDKEIEEILKELENYKYSKNPPKIPKELKRKAIKIYKKNVSQNRTPIKKIYIELLKLLKNQINK